MALTFDEFGMWLHLGGSYWQRASFDAVMVLLGILGLIGFMPTWQHLRTHHFATTAVLLVAVISFTCCFSNHSTNADDKLMPHLRRIEEADRVEFANIGLAAPAFRSAGVPTKSRGYNYGEESVPAWDDLLYSSKAFGISASSC